MKTLLVAPAWVGDMVMAHTLVQCLAAREPSMTIHVAAPPATAALAARMAEVSHVHTVDIAHGDFGWSRRRQAGAELAAEQYDAAYVLPNSWKSALIPYFAGIPQRVGWLGERRYVLLNDCRKLDKSRYPLMIERFMALADTDGELPDKPYPLPALQVDLDNLRDLLAALELSADDVVALCPGAEFGAAKKWPAKHYAEVARNALQTGRQVWLMGSPKDLDDCTAIADLAPGCVNLAGRTSLLDAIDLLSVAEQVVCNDSGLMHIACALGKPTIGVFGSTSPQFTPPLGNHAQVVELSLSCRPCFKRTCPLGHMNCLQKLEPEKVIGAMQA